MPEVSENQKLVMNQLEGDAMSEEAMKTGPITPTQGGAMPAPYVMTEEEAKADTERNPGCRGGDAMTTTKEVK